MAKPRNSRSDSASAAVLAAQNAALGLPTPPAHVAIPDAAMPFWWALMRNRPRHRWNEADLAFAAVLARTQWEVQHLLDELAREADVDAEGTAVNPKHALIDRLVRRAVMLARMLHVHPEATEGRAREGGKTLAIEREAEAMNDPLIPTLQALQ